MKRKMKSIVFAKKATENAVITVKCGKLKKTISVKIKK